jgi:hypothetical protein
MVPMLTCGLLRSNLAFAILNRCLLKVNKKLYYWAESASAYCVYSSANQLLKTNCLCF